MKKFLPYILILVLAVGIFSPIPTVKAQEMGTCSQEYPIDDQGHFGILNTPTVKDDCKSPNVWTPPGGTVPISNLPGIENAGKGGGGGSWGCGLISFLTWDCVSSILSRFAYLIMSVAAFLLWIAGTLLNIVLNYTIINLSENLKSFVGINIAWKVIRDLMNIAFIFLLIYEGILVIIQLSNINKVRTLVVGIVMASILINFSLFFTKILIDASNIVTIGFYQSIIDTSNVPKIETTGLISQAGTNSWSGLSVPFMNSLGLANFYSSASFEQIGTRVGGGTNMLIFFLMGTIIFVVASFVFFAVTCMFVIRYVTLLILLMLSPIAYMGLAFPQMKRYASEWWSSLNGQLLFGPIYMIMTWVILTLMQSGFTNTGNWGSIVGVGDVSSLGLIFNFVVIIGLIIASLVIAKSTSSQGSKFIGDATSGFTKFAGNAVMGGAGVGMRNTIGRLALRKTNIDELEARAAEGDRGAKARLSLAKGSFDVRRSMVGEAVAKRTQTDFGKGIPFNPKAGEGGQAGTFSAQRKDIEADLDKIMKRYVDKRDWNGLATYMQNKPALTTAGEWEKQQKYIYKKLGQKEKVELERAMGTTPATATLINNMRGKLPIDDQIKIYTDRKDWGVMATWILTKNPQDQQYIYEKMSARDRVELDGALRTNGPVGAALIPTLKGGLSTEDQEKTREVEKKAAKAAAQEVIQNNIEALVAGTLVPTPTLSWDTEIPRLSPKEAHELSNSTLSHIEVIHRLTPQHLADIIANKDDLDQFTKDAIRNEILNGTATYPLNASQKKYLNSNPGVQANWGV